MEEQAVVGDGQPLVLLPEDLLDAQLRLDGVDGCSAVRVWFDSHHPGPGQRDCWSTSSASLGLLLVFNAVLVAAVLLLLVLDPVVLS